MSNDGRTHLALFVLRLTGVSLAVAHGWGKVTALASGQGDRLIEGVSNLGFPLPVVFAWSAALAELVGGLLIAIGLFTRIAAAFAAFTMMIAGFVRHHFLEHQLVRLGLSDASPETVQSWGNPELAMVYLAVFLAITLLGGGRWTLDRAWKRRRRS